MKQIIVLCVIVILLLSIQVVGYRYFAPTHLGKKVIEETFIKPGFVSDTILIDPVLSHCGNEREEKRMYNIQLTSYSNLSEVKYAFKGSEVMIKTDFSKRCAKKIERMYRLENKYDVVKVYNYYANKVTINCYGFEEGLWNVKVITGHKLNDKELGNVNEYFWFLYTWISV